MPTISITITVTEEDEAWIAKRFASGGYGSASEYIHELIRKDEAESRGTNKLNQLLQEGLDSNISPRSVEDIRQDVKRSLRADGKLSTE